jgi:hypothetical protein
MKRLSLILAASTLLSGGALAQPRPLTLAMSCGQANHLVARRGAIVLSTGRYTYDRYVRNQAFCFPTQYVRPAVVPAADTPQCFVGYTCTDDPPWLFGW